MSDTTISLPELAGAAAFCVLILDKTFYFVVKLLNKGKDGNGNETITKMRTNLRDDMRSVLIERGICTTLESIRDAVNELVVLERRNQR